MQRTSGPPLGGDAAEASVAIRCPVGEVFQFYRNFRNLPRFLGDVMAVEQTGPATWRCCMTACWPATGQASSTK